ncbi:hypothetical protein V7138_21430 [Bacillus sp. JJ1533]|uniref:hypothetical protein n=1 Tax=Bacillus sp. JJ1533 TaxID=3122959 RepID=UPI002FFD9159
MDKNTVRNLLGRAIQVNKGGPESTVGKLLSITEDYIVIQTENGETIFYTMEHIKGIIEDSRTKFNPVLDPNENTNTNDTITFENFNQLMTSLVGEVVRINRGGPESKTGKLVEVKNDYLIIYDKMDGLIFYAIDHIKSVTKLTMETNEDGSDSTNNSQKKETEQQKMDEYGEENTDELEQLMTIVKEVEAENLTGILNNLQYGWIKINRKGPESLEGALAQFDNDNNFLVLVDKHNVIRIPLNHMKSFSFKLQNNEEQDNSKNKSEANSNNTNDQDQDNQDKGKNVSGNKNKNKKDSGDMSKASEDRGGKNKSKSNSNNTNDQNKANKGKGKNVSGNQSRNKKDKDKKDSGDVSKANKAKEDKNKDGKEKGGKGKDSKSKNEKDKGKKR